MAGREPSQYPGAPAGFNSILKVSGYGGRYIRATAISYGIEIRSSVDQEAANRRAFYPITTNESEFTVTIGHIDWAERERFNIWMSTYMHAVADNRQVQGYMFVHCPTRGFARIAVPKGTLNYGEALKDMAYSTTITFVGASDPLDLEQGVRHAGASFLQPLDDGSIETFFYPTGDQLFGDAKVDGALFDFPDLGGFINDLPDTPLPIPPHREPPGGFF